MQHSKIRTWFSASNWMVRILQILKTLLMSFWFKHEFMWATIGQSQIWDSKEQKPLDIIIIRGVKFDEYILE